MKNYLLLIGFLLFCKIAFSQEFELGKVTVDELQKKHSSIDSSAAAEILFRKGTYKTIINKKGSFALEVVVDTKIKIYSKEGYEWANHEFPVFSEGITVLPSYKNAYTYNLVDGEIERTKLKREGEFTEEVNKYYELRKIKMPNVKEGSIIEFSYTYRLNFFRALPEWFFEFKIPVVYSELTVITPAHHQYNIHLKPSIPIDRSVIEKLTEFGFKETTAYYQVRNVHPYKEEAFVTNVNNFISSVRYEMAARKSLFSGEVTNYAVSWGDVAKTIYDNDYFGKELKLEGYFEKDLTDYIATNSQKYDKTEAIYNFVKNRMNWNGHNSKYVDLGVKKAYLERAGNTADINLMLVAMFRSQGINANPVITSTRNNGIAFSPNVTAYNYVLAAVESEEGYYLYDATSKNAAAQVVPIRALNWLGRILYDYGQSLEVDMMPTELSKSIINAAIEIQSDGHITGKYREQMTDYNAFIYREEYSLLTKESNLERIEKSYSNIEVTDLVLKNLENVYEPVLEEVTFNKSNAVDVIGDKIYFSPMFIFGLKTNPFKSDKRVFPIDFIYPNEDKFMISIKIPEGYEIESMPESVVLEFEEDMLSYKYQLNKTFNSIQISQSFINNTSIIPESNYQLVKDFFTKVVEKNKEQIVLKKSI